MFKVLRWTGSYMGLLGMWSVVVSASAAHAADLPQRGLVAIVNLPPGGPEKLIERVADSQSILYFQSEDAQQVRLVQRAAARIGLFGTRVFADQGPPAYLQLADNVVDRIVATTVADRDIPRRELLRVLRPGGIAQLDAETLVKREPAGTDAWTHPYHGPDNNPQSADQLAGGPLRTQFIAAPKFSPMPQQTVIAGGRMFKAMGHIAHKANQVPVLNTLLCMNAYNGTVLWQRPLPAGFMIHRNTMIATDDALLMGDHESCKVLDAETGDVRSEITVPAELTDGPTWKWMALRDGVLYAVIGHEEIKVDTQPSSQRGLGHWPWGMWKGYDYKDPRTSFGFGRTLLAIDLETRSVLWHYRDAEYLDCRATVMNRDFIFCWAPEKFLACIDRRDGRLVWKNSDADLLDAIGPNERAQHYITGFSTSCYAKCNEDMLFFAGPQRQQLVAARAADGSLAWTYPVGNLQLVLRDDAVYAAGPQQGYGVRLDYASGRVLSRLRGRRACTRATGNRDSIFFRANGGTARLLTAATDWHHIAPMRPPCHDGVLISHGHLYWGAWMCGCQLSLYGNICLAPQRQVDGEPPSPGSALRVFGDVEQVLPLDVQPGDWPTYRGDNARSGETGTQLPDGVAPAWSASVCEDDLPTAPVAAGGLVFVADRTGKVGAWDRQGERVWEATTCGAIYYPPAVAENRCFVGSADGRVYAFEAATGRPLWSARVAPQQWRIPIFGKLLSIWPVAGGVVVRDGVVYAAAGIAHYDGTHVVALDAVTGRVKARNSSSGALSETVNSGISLQGNLMIRNDELQFLGGNVHEFARYALDDLRCLNQPSSQVAAQYHTAFYPYYPEYGKYVSLDTVLDDGSLLYHDASYEGNLFTNLTLQAPLPAGTPRPRKPASRWIWRRGKPASKILWRDEQDQRFTTLTVCNGRRILAGGYLDAQPDEAFLAGIDVRSGTDVWRRQLPALPVKGGVAVDAQRRIFVTMENGELACFVPAGS